MSKKIIIKFDNLVRPDPEFVGDGLPIKAKVDSCQLSALEDVGRRARKAGEQFVKIFQKQ